MSILAKTEAIHEYISVKLNVYPETEEEKKFDMWKEENSKTRKIKPNVTHPKARRLDCNRCGAPNWSKQNDCPAKWRKCIKCSKLGHYAKCCRTTGKIDPHST